MVLIIVIIVVIIVVIIIFPLFIIPLPDGLRPSLSHRFRRRNGFSSSFLFVFRCLTGLSPSFRFIFQCLGRFSHSLLFVFRRLRGFSAPMLFRRRTALPAAPHFPLRLGQDILLNIFNWNIRRFLFPHWNLFPALRFPIDHTAAFRTELYTFP